MDDFIENSFALVDKAVEKYLSRGFNYISVSYGCTGGQHRSVYSAQKLYNYLKEKYDIIVEVNHREQGIKSFKTYNKLLNNILVFIFLFIFELLNKNMLN